MPRRLKDLYPCDTCASPVEVRSRSEIQYARCRSCSERKRLLSLACSQTQIANGLYEKHNRAHEDPLVLAPFMFDAAERAITGAGALIQAARDHAANPAERANWVRIAISWSKWATSVNDSARRLLADLAPARAQLVEAPIEPIELTAPKVGHLRVMKAWVTRPSPAAPLPEVPPAPASPAPE